MGLAVDDLCSFQVCGLQHDEERAAVDLDLGPLVCMVCVFDREFMQTELFLDLAQQRVVRLVQPEPDERIRLLDDFADVVNGDVAKALAIAVGDTVDDARHAAFAPFATRQSARRLRIVIGLGCCAVHG